MFILAAFGGILISLLSQNVTAVKADTTAKSLYSVKINFKELAGGNIEVLDNVVTQTFLEHGYTVLHQSSRLSPDLLVKGSSQVHISSQPYHVSGVVTVAVSRADVSAKVILASSGQVLLAVNTSARQMFDDTGSNALQEAAAVLSAKLLDGLKQRLPLTER